MVRSSDIVGQYDILNRKVIRKGEGHNNDEIDFALT